MNWPAHSLGWLPVDEMTARDLIAETGAVAEKWANGFLWNVTRFGKERPVLFQEIAGTWRVPPNRTAAPKSQPSDSARMPPFKEGHGRNPQPT